MSVFDSSAKKIIDLLGLTALGSKEAADSLGVVLSTDTGLCTTITALVAITVTDTETAINLADYLGAPHRAMRVRCRDSAAYPAAEIRMAFTSGPVVATSLYSGAIVIPVGSEWTLPPGVFNKAYNTLYLASVVVPVFVEIELWVSPTGV